MSTGFVYFVHFFILMNPNMASKMKLFNIPWATANKSILPKRYTLFMFFLEGNSIFFFFIFYFLFGYMYVFCQLGGLYIVKLWSKSWKCCQHPQVEGSVFKSELTVFVAQTESKRLNNLFIFPSASGITLIIVERLHAHIGNALLGRWLEKTGPP